MSPSEVAREKLIALLADENTGLNAYFVAICQRKGIEVMAPGTVGTVSDPFVFDPNDKQHSPNVLRIDANVDILDGTTLLQYPCLLISARAAAQEKAANRRLSGWSFGGSVILDVKTYVAWSVIAPPEGNDFETHLDALEEAFLAVLNADPQRWQPVLYANTVDFSRTPLTLVNNGQLWRRSLQATVTTRVQIQQAEPLL